MFLYTVIEAIIAVIAGILIAICTKKADTIVQFTYCSVCIISIPREMLPAI